MLVYGPIIFGLLFGVLLGSRLRFNKYFTLSSAVCIFILAIIVAWQLGQFPYYNDLPIASGFLSAAIGIFLAKLLFGKEN